jgi:hypothetical protein
MGIKNMRISRRNPKASNENRRASTYRVIVIIREKSKSLASSMTHAPREKKRGRDRCWRARPLTILGGGGGGKGRIDACDGESLRELTTC